MRTFIRYVVVAAVMIVAIGLCGRDYVARYLFETHALTTGPNGSETPQSVDVPFERVQLSSGPRHLDSYVVVAPPTCPHAPLILIYHGIQETISEWVMTQRFLYEHCVSSVVFDYTGSGDSSRPARFEAVNEDSLAAYEQVRAKFPEADMFVLGHSMGNGPMLEAAGAFRAPPNGVIVCSPFVSLRVAGSRSSHIIFRFLAASLPDWWNNQTSVQNIRVPILVVHSDADRVIPLADGRTVFEAAREPKRMVVVHGFGHNDLYKAPTEDWWGNVLAFVSTHRSVK